MIKFIKNLFVKQSVVESLSTVEILHIKGEQKTGFLTIDIGLYKDGVFVRGSECKEVMLPIKPTMRPTVNRIIEEGMNANQDDLDILKSYVKNNCQI